MTTAEEHIGDSHASYPDDEADAIKGSEFSRFALHTTRSNTMNETTQQRNSTENSHLTEGISSGTAPYNESQHKDNYGNDDGHENQFNEATGEHLPPGAGDTPDGFYWAKDGKGKPLLKPLRGTIDALAGMAGPFFEDTDERHAMLKRDSALFRGLNATLKKMNTALEIQPVIDLAKRLEDNPEPADVEKQLSLAVKRLENVNQYMGVNFIRAVCKQAEQDFANSLYWADIHVQNIYRHRENGNEDAAEKSLGLFESSRAQALLAAQIMDWAGDNEVKPDVRRGVTAALGLRGWSLTNATKGAERAAARESTTQALYGQSVL